MHGFRRPGYVSQGMNSTSCYDSHDHPCVATPKPTLPWGLLDIPGSPNVAKRSVGVTTIILYSRKGPWGTLISAGARTVANAMPHTRVLVDDVTCVTKKESTVCSGTPDGV